MLILLCLTIIVICISMPEHANAGLEGQVFYNIHDKEKPYSEQVIDVCFFTCPSICKLWELMHNNHKEGNKWGNNKNTNNSIFLSGLSKGEKQRNQKVWKIYKFK